MSFVREMIRVCAFLLCLVVVFMLPLALFGYNLKGVLFEPDVLLQIVAEEVLESSLLAETVETAVANTIQQIAPDADSATNNFLTSISQQSELLNLLLPKTFIVEIARQLIDNTFTWLESPDDQLILQFDLRPFKSALETNATAVVNNTLAQLPPCTAAETAELAGSLLSNLLSGEEATIPSCLPDFIPLETLVPLGQELLLQQISALPNDVTFNNLSFDPERLQIWKARIQLSKLLLQWTLPVTLFLLIIGTLFGGQSGRGFALWLGIVLLIGGLFTLLFAVALFGLRQPIAFLFAQQMPLLLRPFSPAFFRGVLLWAQRPLIWQGLLQWLIAIVLLLPIWIIRPARKRI